MFNSVDDKVTRREFENYANALRNSALRFRPCRGCPASAPTNAPPTSVGGPDGLANYRFQNRAVDGSFFVAPHHDEYFPVLYSTVPKTSPLYGLDTSPYSNTRAQIDHARDNATLGFYPLPNLASATGVQHGFVFLLPVYQQGRPNQTVEDRRGNLVGFVSGAMVTAKMVDAVLSPQSAPRGSSSSSSTHRAGRMICRFTRSLQHCA